MSTPNLVSFQRPNDVGGAVSFIFDPTITGTGFTGVYRPATTDDMVIDITASGDVSITGNTTVNASGLVSITGGVVNVNEFTGTLDVTGNITILNPVTEVGITGQPIYTTGQIEITNPVTQVGITGQPLYVTGDFGGGSSIVGISGEDGTIPNVSSANGYNALAVFIASGGAGGGSSMVGITGQDGTSSNVTNANGYDSLAVFITSGGGGGGSSMVGISGEDGTVSNVSSANGYNALAVFVASGGSAGMVGISGEDAQVVTVIATGEITGVAANVQGVKNTGYVGAMPLPVLAGAITNIDISGTYFSGALNAQQSDLYGNIWVSLGTALSHLVDSIATRKQLPTAQDVYSIDVTGTGFSNYTGVIPLLSGTSVSLSMEPHSENTGSLYYAFDSGATTGNSWELVGERTIEVFGTADVFFASQTGTQRVMLHYAQF